MTDLYLIAHKVRGEAAFDVASKMTCPECDNEAYFTMGCVECDQLGYWWIIPTSGHRAYPYWANSLDNAVDWEMLRINGNPIVDMPEYNLPDHYPTSTPTKGPTLAERLGLTKVVGKITRRL
jgi:hypothetical protein